MQSSVKALSMQERYSLVAACKFLVRNRIIFTADTFLILDQTFLVSKTIPVENLEEQGRALIRAHGRPVLRAVLIGIAGGAPSTAMNLVDLLLALVTRCLDECKVWIPQIMHSVSRPSYSSLLVSLILLSRKRNSFQRKRGRKTRTSSLEQYLRKYHLIARCLFLMIVYYHSRSRSTKRTREAAQQFTIVAKGLEGSSFGYASLTM